MCIRDSGSVNRLARQCEVRQVEAETSLWLVHGIAVRRHNRTHGQFFREMARQINQQTGIHRIDAALRAVTHWLNGKYESLEEALAMGAVRTRIPKRTISELEAAKAAVHRCVKREAG